MAESEQETSEEQAAQPASGTVPKRQADAARRLAARRAAKAAAKASKRGDNVLVPDGVEETAEAAASWYDHNARTLWIALAAGLAIGIGAVLAKDQMDAVGHEAAAALGQAVTTAVAPIVKEGEDKPEGVDQVFASVAARAEKAREGYEEVIAEHGDTPAGQWARLGDANALYNLGKFAEAQKAFDALLASSSGYVKWRALEGIGFALEAQKKYPEAQKRFEELAKVSAGALAPLGSYHVARMQVAQNQKDAAIDTLEAMIKAERERATADGKRFEGVVSDAETLLSELAVATGRDTLKVAAPSGLPGLSVPKPAGAGNSGLSQEIVDALRKQLEQQGAGEEGEGLSADIVDALQKSVDEGGGPTKTIKLRAEDLPPAQGTPEAAPAAAPAGEGEPE